MFLLWQILDFTSVFFDYEAESFSNELTSVKNLIIKLSLSSVNYKLLFKRSAGEAGLDIHQKSIMSYRLLIGTVSKLFAQVFNKPTANM